MLRLQSSQSNSFSMKIDKWGLELGEKKKKKSIWILLWETISKAENDNEKFCPSLLNFNKFCFTAKPGGFI